MVKKIKEEVEEGTQFKKLLTTLIKQAEEESEVKIDASTRSAIVDNCYDIVGEPLLALCENVIDNEFSLLLAGDDDAEEEGGEDEEDEEDEDEADDAA